MPASARPDDEQVERHHAHALKARAEKRAHAEGIGVDDDFVSSFVEAFYSQIRKDDLLGPIFAAKIHDWDDHLGRMKKFWRSVLFSSGEYAGNPMIKHVAIPDLDKDHFAHWLELFYATLRDLGGNDEAVGLVGERARMIADSLLTGIAMQRDGLAGSRAGQDMPRP
jgi:hemoglobin